MCMLKYLHAPIFSFNLTVACPGRVAHRLWSVRPCRAAADSTSKSHAFGHCGSTRDHTCGDSRSRTRGANSRADGHTSRDSFSR